MKKCLFAPFILLIGFVLSACSSDPAQSPTGALFSGNLEADEYLGAIEKANQATNEQEQFEVNREPTRAYNTKTGKFEFVPEDTQQYWNEDTRRWEFTPVTPRED